MTTLEVATPSDLVRFIDGATIELRPLGRADGRLIADFADQLSPESGYRRFLANDGAARSRWVASLIRADQRDRLVHGAVAVNEFGATLVAVAESIRDQGDVQRAEFALAVADSWQHMGIGTLLARHVARIARGSGVRLWDTHMLAENQQMLRVLDRVGTMVSAREHLGLVFGVHDLGRD